jgi:hypothetical protein
MREIFSPTAFHRGWARSPLFVLVTLWAVVMWAHARNAPLLTVEQLPKLRQHHQRLLVAISGVWDWAKPGTLVRMDTLASLLDGHVATCEAGYEVHVVLVTYKGGKGGREGNAGTPV